MEVPIIGKRVLSGKEVPFRNDLFEAGIEPFDLKEHEKSIDPYLFVRQDPDLHVSSDILTGFFREGCELAKPGMSFPLESFQLRFSRSWSAMHDHLQEARKGLFPLSGCMLASHICLYLQRRKQDLLKETVYWPRLFFIRLEPACPIWCLRIRRDPTRDGLQIDGWPVSDDLFLRGPAIVSWRTADTLSEKQVSTATSVAA